MLNELDVQLVRWATRLGALRPGDWAALSGASPWTVRSRRRKLVSDGYLVGRPWSVRLRDETGRVVETQATAYTATPKGAALAGEWDPAGYHAGALALKATANASRLTSDHTLGVSRLVAHYAQWAEIATEREIAAMEHPVNCGRTRRAPRQLGVWTVAVPSLAYGHTPDFGVLWGERRLAVEYERAFKDELTYVYVMAGFVRAGIAQAWHCTQPRTVRRLVAAGTRVGLQWDPRVLPGGVRMTVDGAVRLVPWGPGSIVTDGPATWLNGYDLDVPPALLPPLPRRDVRAAWELGRTINPDADDAHRAA